MHSFFNTFRCFVFLLADVQYGRGKPQAPSVRPRTPRAHTAHFQHFLPPTRTSLSPLSGSLWRAIGGKWANFLEKLLLFSPRMKCPSMTPVDYLIPCNRDRMRLVRRQEVDWGQIDNRPELPPVFISFEPLSSPSLLFFFSLELIRAILQDG